MTAHRRRLHFASPFIIVLGCGGAQSPTPDPPDVPGRTWSVSSYVEGECDAHAPMSGCPDGAICNPPPPGPVECPIGMTVGTNIRIVQKPDQTCGVVPDGCTDLACVTQPTPCPDPPGTPRKLKGPFWQVARANDACFARNDVCPSTESACAQAIECPAALGPSPATVRIVQKRQSCFLVSDSCTDASCQGAPTSCPVPVGDDLGALKWLGTRSGNECTLVSNGPIAGERIQKFPCPNDPKQSLKFQIDRRTRQDECLYRAGTAPAVPTPCPR